MKKNRIKRWMLPLLTGAFFLQAFLMTSCEKWTEAEAKDFYAPHTEAYKRNLKEYFKSPHKVMFGWFGNWAGKGGSMQYALMGLPDSVDFVSLWLQLGKLTPAQQEDLREFQARGSRAVYCFTSNEIGKFATPEGVENVAEFWGYADGKEESYIKAARKYALAIADSCEKYNVDGFDIDMELTGTLINFSRPERLDTFMMTLREEFDKKGRLLVADIPAGWNDYYQIFTPKVLRKLDYIIWQSYDIGNSHLRLDDMFLALKRYFPGEKGLWEEVVRKSIVTATFERAADKPKFKGLQTYHPAFGIEHAGIGAYHIEYDYPGNPDYPYVREGIASLNPPIKK